MYGNKNYTVFSTFPNKSQKYVTVCTNENKKENVICSAINTLLLDCKEVLRTKWNAYVPSDEFHIMEYER